MRQCSVSRFPRVFTVLLLAAFLASGCVRLAGGPSVETGRTPLAVEKVEVRTQPGGQRIVALGDLHGDLDAARRALRLAGAIDEQGRWIGGELLLVQTGDQIDRGDGEQAILDLFARLDIEAAAQGGAVHSLNGNHELMNVALDLRYITPGGFVDFDDAVDYDPADSTLAAYPPEQRARVAAFRPGGLYARLLAERPVILRIGDQVFVHGGLLPAHLDYGPARINRETRAWLLGEGPRPEIIRGKDSPVWTRRFSSEVDESDCEMLEELLDQLGVSRMIVGHSVQEEGIRSYCDGLVWCIDVGLAEHYGGPLEVLELGPAGPRVLREDTRPQGE